MQFKVKQFCKLLLIDVTVKLIQILLEYYYNNNKEQDKRLE